MHPHNKLKGSSIFSVSVLALAIAGSANAFEFKAADTDVKIGGYAKLDLIYDVDDDMGNAVNHSAISLDGNEGSEGHADMHAFQSRLNVITSTPSQNGPIKTMIEGDFYGSGGGSFRLRHAYGEWNGILAGQTWTNFSGGLAAVPTIDFTGQGGRPNAARQAQLRYTIENFSVALEDPDSLGGELTTYNTIGSADALRRAQLEAINAGFGEETDYYQGIEVDDVNFGIAKSNLPDLTLRYQNNADAFSYAASAMLRQLEYEGAANEDKATGWGLNVEASAKISPAITVRGSLTHGDGIGGYLNVSPGAPGYVAQNGELETITQTGGVIGMSVAAGLGAFNLSYSISKADLDDAVEDGAYTDSANEVFESTYINYIWSPVDRITYGVEAGLHSREVVDGREGDAVRLQGMVMYSF